MNTGDVLEMGNIGDILYILDYSDGKVYKIKPDKEYDDVEELLNEYGFMFEEVSFMWSTVDTNEIIDFSKHENS